MLLNLRFVLVLALVAAPIVATAQTGPRFDVTVAASAHRGPLTGRLNEAVSRTRPPEPALRISPSGPAIFGVDLEGVAPGRAVTVDSRAIGYPTSLDSLPPGEYWVQALVRVYSQVRRADGKTLWLPMNDGRIAPFNNTPGSLVSEVQQVRIDSSARVAITLTRTLPEPRPPRRHGLGQARHSPEQDADGVLGPADLRPCDDPAASRLRNGNESAVSCDLHLGPQCSVPVSHRFGRPGHR